MAGNLDAPFEILIVPENKTIRTCYCCGKSYPETIRFCPRDGVDLEYAPPLIDDLGKSFVRSRKWIAVSILGAALAILVLVFMISGPIYSSSPGTTESGELIVRTTPSGATIYLDGSQMGAAPIRLANIQPGVHEVRAIYPGYKNGAARIEILPSARLGVVWDLVPLRELLKERYVTELSRPAQGIDTWDSLKLE